MRELVGSIVAALVFGLLHVTAEAPMASFIEWEWSPIVVFVVLLVGSVTYARLIAPRIGPDATDYQRALDGLVDQMYLAENRRGVSKEGRERERAPEDYRARWYDKYGLPRPKPHKVRYR